MDYRQPYFRLEESFKSHKSEKSWKKQDRSSKQRLSPESVTPGVGKPRKSTRELMGKWITKIRMGCWNGNGCWKDLLHCHLGVLK